MKTVLMAHPSADLYGSDRMLLESVRALVETHRVVVALPTEGPLIAPITEAGAEVVVLPTAVLRRAALRPRGFVGFAGENAASVRPILSLIKRLRADVLYVNTVVLPLWSVVGRVAGIPTLCHVHEAEFIANPVVRAGFFAPVKCADLVVFNSRASASTVHVTNGRIIYNGVPGPPAGPTPLRQRLDSSVRLVQVGRLSSRKGTDVAVRAAEILTGRGVAVTLTLVGDSFAGNEEFDDRVRSSAGPNVTFAGHRSSVWASLADADIALVPSRFEPFGNVAVEAMLSGRPVVAAATQGLVEVIDHRRTGVLVEPGSSRDLADAVEGMATAWPTATAYAVAAEAEARQRFSLDRYRHEIREAVTSLHTSNAASAA